MTDPLSLLPIALAAGGGRIGSASSAELYDAQQLVAAGLTLLQRSAPLVRALSGRRSAILLPTLPAYLIALAASEGRGAVLVNPLASAFEIAYQCTDANVGAVFTIASLAPRVPAGMLIVLLDEAPRAARIVSADGTRDIDLGSHFGFDISGERDAPGSHEEAAVVYTSAMHGVPLGALLTHANLLANARSTIEANATTPDDDVLAVLPYSHLFALTVACSAPLLAGARVRTMERFKPAKAARLLADGVTMIAGVPAMFGALLSELASSGIDLRHSALRLCICGGSELSVELQDRWADITGVELRQGYGLTEAAPVCLFNSVNLPNVRGTLGVSYPGVDVAIMPPADYAVAARDIGAATPVADGEVGEICVRGDNVSPGYIGAPETGLPRRGEWLCTGDRGVRNADGTITFLGLLKPMFTRNGFNIYPREIERAVREYPGVVDVAVSAIPPARAKEGTIASLENDIRLRVVGEVDERELLTWYDTRLSAYKRPREVEITPVEPRPDRTD